MKQRAATLSFLACLIVFAGACGNRAGGLRLAPGQTASGNLDSGGATYRFEVQFGEYFSIALAKPSTGVSMSVLDAIGHVARSVACTHDGAAHISELAARDGAYEIQLHRCGSAGEAIPYQLMLTPPAAATGRDRQRIEAERLMEEAGQMVAAYQKDQRQPAIDKYERALRQWTELGDSAGQSLALRNLAALNRDQGEASRALAFERANQALNAGANDRPSEEQIEAQLTLATIHLTAGDTPKALAAADLARELTHQLSTSAGEVQRGKKLEEETEYLRGRILYEQGDDLAAATQALDRSQTLARERGDSLGQARALLYLAAADFNLLRFDTAYAKGREALPIFIAYGDKQGQAMALTYIGHFQAELGRRQDALNTYLEAKELLASSGDFYTQSALFSGIATVHLDLGDVDSAIEFFNLALEKNTILGDRIGMGVVLLRIGRCQFMTKAFAKSLDSYNSALKLLRAASSERLVAYVLQDMSMPLEALGQRGRAIEALNEALAIGRRTQDKRLEAWTETSLGHVTDTGGNRAAALTHYRAALVLYTEIKDRLGELNADYQIADCLRRSGNLKEALTSSRAALRLIEEFRTGLANAGLRTAYFASMRQQYDLNIDILMQLHRPGSDDRYAIEAFETSERSRARTLMDSMGETRASLTEGVDAKLAARSVALRAQFEAKSERLSLLIGSSADAKEITAAEAEVKALGRDADDVEAAIRQQSPRYAALIQPEPLTLEKIRELVLDNNSLLLEFALGQDRSYLWAVGRDYFEGFPLSGQRDIEGQVRRFLELTTARQPRAGETSDQFIKRIDAAEHAYPAAAQELGKTLLGPAADQLGKRRLMIVADGILQYLPFRALPVPMHGSATTDPLVMAHEIVDLPSASTLAVIRAEHRGPTAERDIAVFADGVYEASDKRVTRYDAALRPAPAAAVDTRLATVLRSADLHSLPGTRKEANAILAMVQPNRRLEKFGFDATRAAAMSPEIGRYRYVHFAAHTILNDANPDLSGLVLSLLDQNGAPQDGFLRMRDIYSLKLAAELVVLSACETGLGKDVKGEGLMSMVRGFMYSGTPRVMASLWKVDDEATADLMQAFYHELLENKLKPAAALREAQKRQMQNPRWQSPFYWAGFQLQGDW